MPITEFFIPNVIQNAAVMTILLAFLGYMVTFLIARLLDQRRDRLELVNRRLNEFYGPLYVASKAGNIAYRNLLDKLGKTQSDPVLDSELKEWMLWLTTIFMPLNDVREEIIIKKAYLVIEEQMPQCLLDFVTHVVGYKAVLEKWKEGDYTVRRSLIGWPPEFDTYVEQSYRKLKAEQTELMQGSMKSVARRYFQQGKRSLSQR